MNLLTTFQFVGAATDSFDNIDSATWGAILSVLMLILVAVLIMAVFTIFVLWRMFEKASVEGWKAIVPFYNVYIMNQIGGGKDQLFWWYIGSFAFGVAVPFVGFVGSIAASVFGILITVNFLLRYHHPNFLVYVLLYFLFAPACLFMLKDLSFKGATQTAMPRYVPPATAAAPTAASTPSAAARQDDADKTPLL